MINWIAFQPLTGGMYIGAENAIGHPAKFILTYKGLNDIITKKDGSIGSVGNEAYLINYLSKHDRMPKYYQINRGMFDSNINDLNPEILLEDKIETPDYSNIDLVVGVPVCSGLSMVTSAKDDTKNARNCNMLWMAKYTLNVIKPKIYCFENAPTLMGSRGVELRASFEKMAKEAGYSVLYYKTDTLQHDNCQKRERTFVIFMKWQNNECQLPILFEFEDNKISIKDFFDKIPGGLENSAPVKSAAHNYLVIDFIKEKLGNEWTNIIDGSLMAYMIKNDLLNKFIDYVNKSSYDEKIKEKTIKYVKHIINKRSLGLNYYGDDVCLCKKYFPSVQFRSMPNMLHPSGNRICSIREYLTLMGMPYDFEWFGDDSNIPKIGQNVPANTAKFIVNNCINIINNWNIERKNEGNVIFQNNINRQIKIVA